MAYTRRNTEDGVTVMNKDLYDNVQDGIDECKRSLGGISFSVDENGILTITYSDN